MRRSIVYLIAFVGVGAIIGLGRIGYQLWMVNERISMCIDGSAPQFIQDEAKRQEVCGERGG